MRNARQNDFDRLDQNLRMWRYRLAINAQRLRRAWDYAFGRLSQDDAQHVMLECRAPSGWYPLLILSVDETLEEARENYTDHPALAQLINSACARVGDKWEDYGEAIHEARRWAIEVAADYARQLNIALVPWEDVLPPEPETDSHANLS